MKFTERLKQGIVVFDGAMGTQIQAIEPTEAEWDGKQGCLEVLNMTAPDKVQRIHENYLLAGADVVETNTFGANEIVLAEYDLADRVVEINAVAACIARRAVDGVGLSPRFVAGSIGPGTRLISLGQTDFETMYTSYANQAEGLIQGGVDLFVIETCQDPLQIKCCLLAITDKIVQHGVECPVLVSVTVETTGTLLIGSEIGAVLATLEPFGIQALGMNCATGPEQMRPYLHQICERFDGPVLCQPNAGLPENIDGEMVYTLDIRTFVDHLADFISEEGVSIVGGCCGTTPEYIKALRQRVEKLTVGSRMPKRQPRISSLFTSVTIHQDPAPCFIGERANTNGSKLFRDYLLEENWDGIVDVAVNQQRTGAHALDLCVAYTGRDEMGDMVEAVRRIVTQVDLPLVIDSTDTRVIEKALRLDGGRPVINSINLEDGEERADRICRLARRYGAAVIALTIDEKGMALEVERKVEIAARIYDLAVNRHGLRPQDLIFDTLTFTLGSGDESLRDSAINTLEGLRAIKKRFPGVFTLLGVSNVSFGLKPSSREVLNSVFLAEAVKAGLDCAIVNVKKIMPLYKIDPDDVKHCLDLIYNRGGEDPLLSFIHHFDRADTRPEKEDSAEQLTLEDRIKARVIQGSRSGLQNLLHQALQDSKAVDIINQLLIPAMKTVGELFGSGQMQLPFVLQSAEVMKFAVTVLEPFLEKTDKKSRTCLVLATVRGDVHDIGKNLVDIILSNNGYEVYNLGIKCEIETMLQKAREVNADAIGMSGLLVKSTVVMKENLEEMKRRSIDLPVLLGGAALTRNYVEKVCAPILNSPVVYCADAFDGLDMMERLKNGELHDFVRQGRGINPKTEARPTRVSPKKEEKIRRDIDIPTPPFFGDKIVENIDVDQVFSYLTESVLFRGRWGYRRGRLTREEYDALVENQVRPEFERLKERCKTENLFVPSVVYGYYPCNSDGDRVIVYSPDTGEKWLPFAFPRQRKAPHRCIADYFLPVDSGQRDLIALQVVTVGKRASEEANRLYRSNAYKEYLLFHGLSVEAAEALAEYHHLQIRRELGITESDGKTIEDFIVQKYRGSRYSFGYPACPDLAENRKLFQILRPDRIGVSLTDEDQMVPEQTTSAFIVHHPQAKYFAV